MSPRLSLLACLGLAATACSPPGAAPIVPTRAEPRPSLGASCGQARLLAAPDELAARGPWPVGARTVVVDGTTVEVWYPARPGSDAGVARARYDLRTAMPAAEAAKIPDAANAWLACECARELPIDDAHGPYPVVLFLHGAASFRAQSAFLATHWASRGFITIAPDLPGVGLLALLGGEPTGFPTGVPLAMLEAIQRRPAADDPFAFLRPQLGDRIGIVGHSLGAVLASTTSMASEVGVRIALAGMVPTTGSGSVLLVAGELDGIAPPDRDPARLSGASTPVRSAIVRGAGHLAFTELCTLGADRGGPLAIARAHGVAIPEMIATLATDGCRPTDAPFGVTAPVIRALTTGVLEEALRCDAAKTAAITALARGGDLELVERLAP